MPFLVALAVAFAALLTVAASAAELVPPQVLKRDWLDGRTVSTVGPRGGKSDFSFKSDGTLTRTGSRAGSGGEGRWRLDAEGFCMTLGEAKQESCYVALAGEDGSIRVLRRTGAFTWRR